jgi:hypothetical protein
MLISIFYDSTDEQSIGGLMILKANKFASGSTVTLKDTAGLNESSINAQIAAIGATTQHRVYALVGVDLAHATGDLTTAQVTTLNGKLIGSGTDPDSDDTCRALGEVASDDNPALRVWENTYPNKTAPKVIYYIGGVINTDTIADYYGTSTDGSTSTLEDSGQTWTVDALIGKYIYCISGSGKGQFGEITDNDETSVTVAWQRRPLGSGNAVVSPSNDSVYRIVSYSDRYFVDVAIPYYIKNYLADPTDNTVIANWKKLLDKEGNFESSTMLTPTQDSDYLAEVIEAGLHIFDNSIL